MWRGYRPASCICNVSFPTWGVAKHSCYFRERRLDELRRIPLLRRWVNKEKGEGWSPEEPWPSLGSSDALGNFDNGLAARDVVVVCVDTGAIVRAGAAPDY